MEKDAINNDKIIDSKDEVDIELSLKCIDPVASISSKYLIYKVNLKIDTTILICLL